MRLLGFPFTLLAFGAFGCGLGSTVVGEGPPRADDAEDDARIERTLGAMSSSGPLFVCTFEGGDWPGAVVGSTLSVTRSGAFVSWGNGTSKFDRVDKSGPPYPTYRFMTGEQLILSLEGSGPGRPMWAYRGGTNERFDCRERSTTTTNAAVFDDAQLDALVTATNGRR